MTFLNGTEEEDYVEPDVSLFLYDFAKYLTIIVQPIICIFGLIGNMLSFIIFLSPNMRKISSNVYLAALSGSSCGFLMVLLLQWLEVVQCYIIHFPVMCQLIVYLSYVFSGLSVWFIVCITVENYIVTFHLEKASRFCTVYRARVVVLVMTGTAVLLYTSCLWTVEVKIYEDGVQICTENKDYALLSQIYVYIDGVLTLLIPSILTTTLIMAILSKNWCIRSKPAEATLRRLSKKQKSLLRITRVLLAISLTFVILSGPSQVNKFRHLVSLAQNGQVFVTIGDRTYQQLFQIIYYLTFCLNFVYYVAWSTNYRKGIRKLFCLKDKRRKVSRDTDLLNGGALCHNPVDNHIDKTTNVTDKITLV